ncbi:unnamed protein product [Allacma fusca]|uniref:Uncharacterized protein n=1 Tax=Allacma fusca TaxID=39272 RepID=A0A8J2NW06_9HEXA|nr:unnamed protein product [Allacma fusca]
MAYQTTQQRASPVHRAILRLEIQIALVKEDTNSKTTIRVQGVTHFIFKSCDSGKVVDRVRYPAVRMNEEFRERQEFEVEAIKAIYLADVRDLRQNEDDQPSLAIRLLPQRGSSGGVSQEFSPTTVLMTVMFPSNYPDIVPEISLSESKGLSSQELNELKRELEKLAASSVGEVMVLNLAQFAEGFLYMHQKTPVGSFYDEMLLRKKQLQEQTNQKKQEHLEKERQAIQEEIQRKQDALKEELRRRKEEWKAQNEIITNISPPASYQNSPVKGDGFPQTLSAASKNKKRRSISIRSRRRSTSEGSDSSLSECSDIVILDFSCNKSSRKFQRGEVLGESSRGSKVYAGMDNTSGSLVAICEWHFGLGKKDKKGRLVKDLGGGEGQVISHDSFMKQLNALESEFNLLQKLEHSNIVLYLGLKVISDDFGNICLYVAQEFVRGTTLQSYLQDMLTLDVALVRHCAQGILQALDYLHSNNVVHRFLRDTSVFMDTSGNSPFQFMERSSTSA